MLLDPVIGAVMEFLEGGNHYTFIETFSEEKQKEIVLILYEWLKNE